MKLSDEQQWLIRDWWRWLQPAGQTDAREDQLRRLGRFGVFSRAHRAQLKRCAEPGQVLLVPAFHRLLAQLAPGMAPRVPDAWTWALIAGVLVWVDQEPEGKGSSASFGARMATPPSEKAGRPALSELRFARLLRATDEQDFYTQLRRALQRVNQTAQVPALAQDIHDWLSEFRDPGVCHPSRRLQVRWASDYYTQAAKHTPAQAAEND
jgi:CRISPR system Cascade subunit CasB